MEKIIRIKIKIVLKIIEIIKGIKIILINFVPMKMKSQYKVEINEIKKLLTEVLEIFWFKANKR